jgi:outer membrane protein assembly factor BamB
MQNEQCKMQSGVIQRSIVEFSFCKLHSLILHPAFLLSTFFSAFSAPLRETFHFALVIALFFAGAAHAENWDRFRGPNGAGQSDAQKIPSKWGDASFLWKRQLPGVGHSSPIIWGDKLFITSADASGAQIVSAFDANTGTPLWEKRFDAPSYHINPLNSLASSTPAADAQHLYVMWLNNGRVAVVALDHQANEVWRADAGPFQEQHGFGSSPVVVDGLVCVANNSETESAVTAFDCQTGQQRWQVPRDSGVTAFSTPCVYELDPSHKELITTSTASGMTAIDAATGRIAWQGFEDELPQRCVGSPIVAGGLAIAASGQGGNGKMLVAVRPGDGTHPPQEAYHLTQSIPQVTTPLVAGALLFMWQDRGVVSCYDLATGKQHWRERVGGDFHSSPVRIGDRILCISRKGEAVVLAADEKFQVLARNSLNEPCHATPAVANERLYVRTESTLLCIGERGT